MGRHRILIYTQIDKFLSFKKKMKLNNRFRLSLITVKTRTTIKKVKE